MAKLIKRKAERKRVKRGKEMVKIQQVAVRGVTFVFRMKRTASLVLLPSLLLLAFERPDLAGDGLKGRVKKMVSTEYRVATDSLGNTVRLGLRDSSVVEYNAAGYETLNFSFSVKRNANSDLLRKYRYVSDTLVACVTSIRNGKLSDSISFRYDSRDEKTEAFIVLPGQNQTIHRKFYRTGNQLKLLADFAANGDSLSKTVYEYLGNGRLRSEEEFNRDPKEGRLKSSLVIKYNYDAEGRVAATQTTSFSNQETVQIQYHYNAHGDQEEVIRSTSFGETLVAYSYEYDETGNWIRRTTFSETRRKGVQLAEKKPVAVAVRVFDYFR
jgi:antitoxin component YwqK of YwqJK toxin-antitoxin module